jgi:hypothetical protein
MSTLDRAAFAVMRRRWAVHTVALVLAAAFALVTGQAHLGPDNLLA